MDISSPKSSRQNEPSAPPSAVPEAEQSTAEEYATNEFGIPITGWGGRLMDITEMDLRNAIDFPLAE